MHHPCEKVWANNWVLRIYSLKHGLVALAPGAPVDLCWNLTPKFEVRHLDPKHVWQEKAVAFFRCINDAGESEKPPWSTWTNVAYHVTGIVGTMLRTQPGQFWCGKKKLKKKILRSQWKVPSVWKTHGNGSYTTRQSQRECHLLRFHLRWAGLQLAPPSLVGILPDSFPKPWWRGKKVW